MGRVATICLFIVATYAGWLVGLAILIVPGLLPGPGGDPSYFLIAPGITGVSLAITAIPCALFVNKAGGFFKKIAIGIIQGVLVPVISICIFILWTGVYPEADLLIFLPGLLGSIIAFAIAYMFVNLILSFLRGKNLKKNLG